MAAVTVSNRTHIVSGGVNIVTATLTGTITDGDTWDTGLKQVIFASVKSTEAAAAADDATVTTTLPSTSGTVAIGIAGTIATLSGLAIGY